MFRDLASYKTERNITFLNESNKIESIREIDYHDPETQVADKGHFGAFVLSQELAHHREPLSVRQIKEWQKLITEEQVPYGYEIGQEAIGHIRNPNLPRNVKVGLHVPPDYKFVPSLLQDLVEDINDRLKHSQQFNDSDFCRLIGTSFQRFEAIHPFVDGNGRTGRLLANYIATFCNRPLILFNSDMIERNAYYDAHESETKMWLFMAKKIKEAVSGGNREILTPASSSLDSSTLYKGSGKYQEQVEWHHLNSEIEKWEGCLEQRVDHVDS